VNAGIKGNGGPKRGVRTIITQCRQSDKEKEGKKKSGDQSTVTLILVGGVMGKVKEEGKNKEKIGKVKRGGGFSGQWAVKYPSTC